MSKKNAGCSLIKMAPKKYQIVNQCVGNLKVKGYCLQCGGRVLELILKTIGINGVMDGQPMKKIFYLLWV